MSGQFVREVLEKVGRNETWQSLFKSDLKIGTKALLCATQEQTIRTNYVKHHTNETSENSLSRLCGKKGEIECEKLGQK